MGLLEKLTSHDVVTVSDETEADRQSDDGDLPQRDRGLGADSLASRPSRVHGSPDTDGVSDVVGTVCEGSSAGRDDLHEGIEVFDFVAVLGRVRVHAVHAAAFRSSENADLSAVDIVRHAIEGADDDLSWDADEGGLEVVELVDGAGAELVVVQSAHGPAERSLLLPEFLVVLLAGLSQQETVGLARVFVEGSGPLLGRSVDVDDGDLLGVGVGHGSLGLRARTLDVTAVLDDGVVGDLSELGIGGGNPLEEKRTLEDIPELEGVVLLDHLGVNEGNEEEGGQDEETEANAESDRSNVPSRLVRQAKPWRTLVNDGQGADRAGDEEEEGRGPNGPGNRVATDVDHELDQGEDHRAENTGRDRGHAETGKDGSKAGATVPSPLDLAGAHGSDTDTGDGRNQRVGRRNVGGVACTPHDPDGSTSGRASECEELDTGIAVEGGDGNNAVLDGRGSPGTDSEGTGQFEDQAENHGLLVGDGARGNTGGPGVGNIVCEDWSGSMIDRTTISEGGGERTGTIVVGLKQGKEGADGEDVGVFGEHLGCCGTGGALRELVGRWLWSVLVTRKRARETTAGW